MTETVIMLPLAPGDLDRVLSRPNSGFFGHGAISFLFDSITSHQPRGLGFIEVKFGTGFQPR
jgi:hypothetical protein